jgi:hypothetical protein
MGIAVLGGGPPHYCYYDYAVDLRRHRRHRSWLPRQPGAVPHGPGHAGPGPGRVSPPSSCLAPYAAGQGAIRDRAVIGSGAGRVHCALLPPSRADGPPPVRPRAHGRHLGRSLAHWIAPALRSVGTRRQSPLDHGCRVRARAVVSGPPGAPSQSGATSLDGPVLRALLGRRRRAGSPEGTVLRLIMFRSPVPASQSALPRSWARASSVSQSRRRRARAFQVGPATGPARRCHTALLHSAGGGLTGLSPAPHTGLGSQLRAAGRTTGPARRGDSENGPGIALRFATRNTNQVSHALPHSQPDLGARASCSPCFPCI